MQHPSRKPKKTRAASTCGTPSSWQAGGFCAQLSCGSGEDAACGGEAGPGSGGDALARWQAPADAQLLAQWEAAGAASFAGSVSPVPSAGPFSNLSGSHGYDAAAGAVGGFMLPSLCPSSPSAQLQPRRPESSAQALLLQHQQACLLDISGSCFAGHGALWAAPLAPPPLHGVPAVPEPVGAAATEAELDLLLALDPEELADTLLGEAG